MHFPTFPIAALLVALAGCSAGDTATQQVAIRTAPAGASCTVTRGRTVLGVVDLTPGSLAVGPSDKDLLVTCNKPGWQPASGTVKAIYRGVGLGHLVTGGFAAVVEDAVKSTDFRYDPIGASVTLPPG